MDDILVGRVMSTSLQTVGPETLVEDAAQVMLEEGVGSVLVVDDENQLLGILTTTDFVDIVAKSHPKAQTRVERYMTTDVVTTTAQAHISEAAEAMVDGGFHHLPVVDPTEGAIGIVTTTDLTRYLTDLTVSA